MTGKSIRDFFRELLGSRLVEHLQNQIVILTAEKEGIEARHQEDMLRLRSDFEARLQDKENVAADLRQERAMMMGKIHLYEQTLMPHASRAGADVVAATTPRTKPSFASDDYNAMPVKSRWQNIVEEHEKTLKREQEQEEQRSHEAVSQASALGE